MVDGIGTHMDALTLCIAQVRRQLLHGQQLLWCKPDLVVGPRAIRDGAAEHPVYAVAAQIAVAPRILPSNTAIHIQSGTADQRNPATLRLSRPGSLQCLADIPGLGELVFVPVAPPEARLRDGIDDLTKRLHVLPLWSQAFAVATTRIGSKAIHLCYDLLHAGVLQGSDLVHGIATEGEVVCRAEPTDFLEHPGDLFQRHSLVGATHRPAMLAGGGAAHDFDVHPKLHHFTCHQYDSFLLLPAMAIVKGVWGNTSPVMEHSTDDRCGGARA